MRDILLLALKVTLIQVTFLCIVTCVVSTIFYYHFHEQLESAVETVNAVYKVGRRVWGFVDGIDPRGKKDK